MSCELREKLLLTSDFLKKVLKATDKELDFRVVTKEEMMRLLLKSNMLGIKMTEVYKEEVYVYRENRSIVIYSSLPITLVEDSGLLSNTFIQQVRLEEIDFSSIDSLNHIFDDSMVTRVIFGEANLSSIKHVKDMFGHRAVDTLSMAAFYLDHNNIENIYVDKLIVPNSLDSCIKNPDYYYLSVNIGKVQLGNRMVDGLLLKKDYRK